MRKVRLGKGSAQVCPGQEGLSRAMGTRGQARRGHAHAAFLLPARGGYFQPLRSAGEATLWQKSNTTQVNTTLKSSSHYYSPRRSLHRTEWAAQTHHGCLAIPKSQPQLWQGQGQPSHPHCTHHTRSQLGEPSQTPSLVSKSSQFLFKVAEQKVSDGRAIAITTVIPCSC